MAIDGPEATDGASLATEAKRRTAKEDFVVPRGMAAQPAGEESRDGPLRHRRSRLQPSFDQISPLKRPFGALAHGLKTETMAAHRNRKKTYADEPPASSFPPGWLAYAYSSAVLHHRNARHHVLPGRVTSHSAAVSDASPGTPIGVFGSIRLHRTFAIPLTIELASTSPCLIQPR
jgi:hypothetical protein